MDDVRRTKDGTRRIVATSSQTSTVRLTPGEIEYLDWLDRKRNYGGGEDDEPLAPDRTEA